MTSHIQRITRRRFVQIGAASSLTAAIPISEAAAQTDLFPGAVVRVLLPEVAISQTNDAIRAAASNWAAAAQATAIIDTVRAADLFPMIEAEFRAGTPHDLICAPFPLHHMAGRFEDLTSTFDQASTQFGPPLEFVDRATRLDERRTAIATGYEPAPMIFRRSLWEAYGFPGGPPTWPVMDDIGSILFKHHGLSVAIGYADEPGSERIADAIVRAFGGRMLDEQGAVALDSAETIAAIRFMAALAKSSLSPESRDFTADRPAGLLGQDIACIANDSLSAMRRAQGWNVDVAKDLYVVGPPGGPGATSTGWIAPAMLRSYHLTRASQAKEAAAVLLLHLISVSREIVSASQLAEHPTYASTVPEMVQQGGWLDQDTFGADPADKLLYMKSAPSWTTNYGDVPTGPVALARAQQSFLLAGMMRSAIIGQFTPEDAAREAANTLQGYLTVGDVAYSPSSN